MKNEPSTLEYTRRFIRNARSALQDSWTDTSVEMSYDPGIAPSSFSSP